MITYSTTSLGERSFLLAAKRLTIPPTLVSQKACYEAARHGGTAGPPYKTLPIVTYSPLLIT